MQSQELDWILVVLSNWGYSRIVPRAALSLLPQQELLLRAGSKHILDPLLWGGASSCHSGQRDEAGLGLPFLMQEGYPLVRPLLTELC